MRASRVLFAPRARLSSHLREIKTANVIAAEGQAPGRLIAIDLGAKRVGVAVCDELRMTVRRVETLQRRSWKDLLSRVSRRVAEFDAHGLVIGLPLNLDGSEGAAAAKAREIASKFERSLSIPVHLQDERLTSEEAKSRLRHTDNDLDIDSEAAAIILEDFLARERSTQS
jgi:putative holliday junction resolvase